MNADQRWEVSNWKFFVKLLRGYKPYFKVPMVSLIDDRENDTTLKSNPEAWGYYNPEEVKIVLMRDRNNLPMRIHEYGHWLNCCVYFILEIIWEFFWWGLGIRGLFDAKEADHDHD